MTTVQPGSPRSSRSDSTPDPIPLPWLVIGAISAGMGVLVYHETGSVSAGVLGMLTTAGALYTLMRRRRA